MNHVVSHSPTTTPTVADTGATDHFFDKVVHTAIPIKNIQPTTKGVEVVIPNGTTMKAAHTEELYIPDLPIHARRVHIFPHLASGSLLSIGKLCDAGCHAIFTAKKL